MSKVNLDVLAFYIKDFARVWLYRARVMKEGCFGRTIWFGSHYDKAALAALRENLAGFLAICWLLHARGYPTFEG